MIRVAPDFRVHSSGNVCAILSLRLEGLKGNSAVVAAQIAHFFPDGEVTEALDMMVYDIGMRIKYVQSLVFEEQRSIIIDRQSQDR